MLASPQHQDQDPTKRPSAHTHHAFPRVLLRPTCWGQAPPTQGSYKQWGKWASHLHRGAAEDHSATLCFQTQVSRPAPTIWWPEGQWNTMTVPTEVPLPRRTWKVPLRGGCTCEHVPGERGEMA